MYDKIDPKRIINVYQGDSYTVDDKNNLTNRVNRIATPKEIVESNSSFSEINIANEKNRDYNETDENYKYKLFVAFSNTLKFLSDISEYEDWELLVPSWYSLLNTLTRR